MRILSLIFAMMMILGFTGNSMDNDICFKENIFEIENIEYLYGDEIVSPVPVRSWPWERVLLVVTSDLVGAASGVAIVAEASAAITVGSGGTAAPLAGGILAAGAVVGGAAASLTAGIATGGRIQSSGGQGGIFNPIDISFSDELINEVGIKHNLFVENAFNSSPTIEEGRFIDGLPENIKDVFSTDKWNFRKNEMLNTLEGMTKENYKNKINQLSNKGLLTNATANFFKDFITALYKTKNANDAKELLLSSLEKVRNFQGVDKVAIEAGLSTFNYSLAYWSQKETNE